MVVCWHPSSRARLQRQGEDAHGAPNREASADLQRDAEHYCPRTYTRHGLQRRASLWVTCPVPEAKDIVRVNAEGLCTSKEDAKRLPRPSAAQPSWVLSRAVEHATTCFATPQRQNRADSGGTSSWQEQLHSTCIVIGGPQSALPSSFTSHA